MGLGTGYMIYRTQELFGDPKRGERADFAAPIWMPGFLQFITGAYLFLGLTLSGTFAAPALYMAALAFTAYWVHWFAMGWNRLRRPDPRVNVGMTVAFTFISILGIIVFFKVGDDGVGGLFIGPDLHLRFRLLRRPYCGPAREAGHAERAGARFLLPRHRVLGCCT